MELNTAAPYITVVVAVRNDHRGGGLTGRLQTFLETWSAQAQRYGLSSEIVVVEWNQPADLPKLIDSLPWPLHPGPCEIRFIEVPLEVHQRYPNAHALPLHRMLAKNVGIRRSRGEFVLVTSIDSVFSDELMQFLAARRLEKRTVYRIDRHDVSNGISAHATPEELEAFCRNNIRRVLAAEGTFAVDRDGLKQVDENDIAGPHDGIRLGAGWFPVESSDREGERFRWISSAAEIIFQRPPGSALLMDVEAGPSAAGGLLQIEIVDPEGAVLASAMLQGRSKLRLAIPDKISSGLLGIRLKGNFIPLEMNSRFLKLRVFGLAWESSPWSPQSFNTFVSKQERPGSIRVRSMDPREIQLALISGPGANLDSLGVRLVDRAGNVLCQLSADHLPPATSGEYLLALDLGFKLAARADSPESGPEWFLEVLATRPGANWKALNQNPSPFAHQMRAPAFLHTNACDDFLLLSREDWFALRGFAEFPIWPKHIDSLFCYSAYHAGMRELVLGEPLRLFHIEQHSASGWTPESELESMPGTDAGGVKSISNVEIVDWIERMRRLDRPLIFTRGNWGLADDDLKETTLGLAQLSRMSP